MIENALENGTFSSSMKQLGLSREEILEDFKICCISREASLMARKEVLTGKAKFGITGDGKEVPQVAMAKAFRNGDFRSGYYRDQTLMFALGVSTIEDFFAQLYADPENDPFSGGRQMNNHFATPLINQQGEWISHVDQINISSDVSCTGGQMARALGLAFASKKYRELSTELPNQQFSKNGNEVCFCTIGDASTSEGIFWETINASGVLQVPLSVSVWDDGYGISVPIKFQTTKESISKALAGFQATDAEKGIEIFEEKGWNYAGLVKLYKETTKLARKMHIPVLIHITEVTQPQGHSTSGSHERYKSKDRLKWEREYDCIVQMEKWMHREGFATIEETKAIRTKARKEVKIARDNAWKRFTEKTKASNNALINIYDQLPASPGVNAVKKSFKRLLNPTISEIVKNARQMWFELVDEDHPAKTALKAWLDQEKANANQHYHSNLYSHSPKSGLNIPIVAPEFDEEEGSTTKNGYEVLNEFFKTKMEEDSRIIAFGEDVGKIGDVNQGFAGLQKRFGEKRVFDTGIREWSIMGQALGLAMRGLRPIAEIQYLDYLIYGLEVLSDDIATLRYRSDGLQQAPVIIRTRGHRLEGIWHAGSPMGMILNAVRGMYVLVPRNMTQAAGFYNTMLQSDDPALVIECLNGYRLKEQLPSNLKDFTVPLGVPEVLQQGSDVTLVTYGSCVRIAQAGMKMLESRGISVELIDVQSLLPFDLEHRIVASLKKTNRIVFMDEDVPGGATAYMMREVLEKQGGYQYLDAAPVTLTAKAHRPPYGSDGDYFSKPNPEDVFETIYNIMQEAKPRFFNALG